MTVTTVPSVASPAGKTWASAGTLKAGQIRIAEDKSCFQINFLGGGGGKIIHRPQLKHPGIFPRSMGKKLAMTTVTETPEFLHDHSQNFTVKFYGQILYHHFFLRKFAFQP